MAMWGKSPLDRRGIIPRHAWVPVYQRLRRVLGSIARRGIDWGTASLLLLLLALPVFIPRYLQGRVRHGHGLARERLLGRHQVEFERLTFSAAGIGQGIPKLVNVLNGSLSLAGPRPIDSSELAALPPVARDRFLVRPGIFSPHGLKQQIGIAFDSELDSDLDYVYTESTGSYLGIVLRSLFVKLLGGKTLSNRGAETKTIVHGNGASSASRWLNFFGVRIVNLSMPEALDMITAAIAKPGTKMINFVNPHCLNVAYTDPRYKRILSQAEFILPDGIGLHQGCRILGCQFNSNINGTDLFPRLCERLAAEGKSIFLLGAQPGAAETSGQAMLARFPQLKIAGTRDGFFKPEEEVQVIKEINAAGADILLVAMGVPRQEFWIDDNLPALKVSVAMGVGGLFDYYSGRIPRAPQWIREIGMEWVWRLLQEPGRMWKRYLVGNFLFLYRVWKQARAEKPGS